MKYSVVFALAVGLWFASFAAVTRAEEDPNKAIEQDRKLIAGTWKITALEVNGNPAKAEDVQKLTVVNGSDGTWSLRSQDKEIAKGSSTIDPSRKPKTIDFTSRGEGGQENSHVGIYELGQNARKLCFALTGNNRPTEFASSPGSGHVLVTFEREETKP